MLLEEEGAFFVATSFTSFAMMLANTSSGGFIREALDGWWCMHMCTHQETLNQAKSLSKSQLYW